MSNSKVSSTGIGFPGLLAVVFITLKLCKVINWSWIWVLSPLWIPLLIVILIGGVFFISQVIKHSKK
ncbi:MAG: hypothetical protein E2590_12635 [Chryseobacterium sp.]|nr:hypothetical protein [Chryseobacterium sp.]